MEEVSGNDAAESVMWSREDWPEGLIISYGTDATYKTAVYGDSGLLSSFQLCFWWARPGR